MHSSSKVRPSWWDREHDRSGREIRQDVRLAAELLWPRLFRLAGQVLTDAQFEAQEILESVVETVSRYLTSKNAPQHDPSGLLVVKFRQELYRAARKHRRLETIGGADDLAELLHFDGWVHQAERRVFFQELIQALSERSRGILRLRIAGCEWKEIARALQINESSLRNSFWRDVRKVYQQFMERPVEELPR
jgi:DNA-directed RNA polymerase specialized sigma24 family protein